MNTDKKFMLPIFGYILSFFIFWVLGTDIMRLCPLFG
jgi:hypothetical protein